jgi:hypothetical protein
MTFYNRNVVGKLERFTDINLIAASSYLTQTYCTKGKRLVRVKRASL